MAQNITLMGASYSDVPAVTLPKTGGGTARFDDTSDANAAASDIISGKTAYVNGQKITGTGSGGGGGGGGETASPKDVNFIDYDGTIVHSYTAEEFAALTAMPANPSHTGLTAQGWNWSLSDAKAQLAAMPDAGLTIGQMYITDDGKTRIYCHFEQGRLAPYLGLGVKGTVVVDWGDGSNTDSLTGTSLTTAKTVQHIYATEGDYTITLTVSSGNFAFFGTSNVAHILKKSTATTGNISRVYANCIRRVELGGGVSIGSHAFLYCTSLVSITIPDSVTSISNNAFQYCYSLASITIPDGVTSISDYMFHYCYSLSFIAIPDGVTRIGNYGFAGCYSLASITIPDGVTSIDRNAFQNCDFLSSITIPDGVTSIGASAFYNCYSLASITIPDGVTSIDAYCFQNCESLASITIPDGITSFGNYALQNCYSLASITIPDGVTSIGSSTFQNCYGLGEMHFLPATPPTVSASKAFSNVQSDCIIYVPTGSLAAYTSATNYPSSSTFTYVEE